MQRIGRIYRDGQFVEWTPENPLCIRRNGGDMISWRARDAYWIPDPIERGDIDRELDRRVWYGNWGVSLEIEQPTEDPPRLYAWEYTCMTAEGVRVLERGFPMPEERMLANLSSDQSTTDWAWGFTFVRVDP